jgi:hypothetical protein
MPRSYDEYKFTPLWRALASAVRELEANGELKIDTAPDYVIGYLYQELVAKAVVASDAAAPDR